MTIAASPGEPPAPPFVAFFPAAQARIIPNWDVIGLRATGSHDVTVNAISVPEGRTCPLIGPVWSTDPIANIPFFVRGALLMAGVPLGVAAHALELEHRAGRSSGSSSLAPSRDDAEARGGAGRETQVEAHQARPSSGKAARGAGRPPRPCARARSS